MGITEGPPHWVFGRRTPKDASNAKLLKDAILIICPDLEEKLKTDGNCFWLDEEECKRKCETKRCELLNCVLCKGNFLIKIGERHNNIQAGEAVTWDPWGWSKTKNKGQKEQSLIHPLQTLVHELGHACRSLNPNNKDKNKKPPSAPEYTNLEEEENIKDWENPIVKEMKAGELGPYWNERNSHAAETIDGRYDWSGMGRVSATSGNDTNLRK